MPLEDGEFPDPRRHRFCTTCQKWHHPEHGTEQVVRPGGPFGSLISGYRAAAGIEPRTAFTCQGCAAGRHRGPLAVAAAVVGVLLLAAIAILVIDILWRAG